MIILAPLKFMYDKNTIYSYEYNVTVNTWFSKASENQSTLEISSEVMNYSHFF